MKLGGKLVLKVRPKLPIANLIVRLIFIMCIEQSRSNNNFVVSSSSGSDTNNNHANFVGTAVIGNSSGRGTIVMGYLMDQLSAPYRIGAIQMAIEDGQANGLLQGFNFRYLNIRHLWCLSACENKLVNDCAL